MHKNAPEYTISRRKKSKLVWGGAEPCFLFYNTDRDLEDYWEARDCRSSFRCGAKFITTRNTAVGHLPTWKNPASARTSTFWPAGTRFPLNDAIRCCSCAYSGCFGRGLWRPVAGPVRAAAVAASWPDVTKYWQNKWTTIAGGLRCRLPGRQVCR